MVRWLASHDQASPDIFTVFTCDPKWPEIAEDLEPQHKAGNTTDIIIRVYHMKLLEYLQKIETGKVFGVVAAVVHTVEFQKRGLPHAHIFVWQKRNNDQGSKLIDVDDNTTLAKTMGTTLTEPLNLEVRKKMVDRRFGMRGPPPAVQYCGKLEKYCHWGNKVKLYTHHVDTLFAMFWHKKPEIPYYVCTINKAFAKPDHRMYFQVWYTQENLEDYIDPDDDTLKVKLADSDLHADCRIFLGTDKRATITTNWSKFCNLANIYEGDICAFRFKVTKKRRLVLIVHRL